MKQIIIINNEIELKSDELISKIIDASYNSIIRCHSIQVNKWIDTDSEKIFLQCNQSKLEGLNNLLNIHNIPHALATKKINSLESFTPVCLCIGPASDRKIDKFIIDLENYNAS